MPWFEATWFVLTCCGSQGNEHTRLILTWSPCGTPGRRPSIGPCAPYGPRLQCVCPGPLPLLLHWDRLRGPLPLLLGADTAVLRRKPSPKMPGFPQQAKLPGPFAFAAVPFPVFSGGMCTTDPGQRGRLSLRRPGQLLVAQTIPPLWDAQGAQAVRRPTLDLGVVGSGPALGPRLGVEPPWKK